MYGVLIFGILSGQRKEAQNVYWHYIENGIEEKQKTPRERSEAMTCGAFFNSLSRLIPLPATLESSDLL